MPQMQTFTFWLISEEIEIEIKAESLDEADKIMQERYQDYLLSGMTL